MSHCGMGISPLGLLIILCVCVGGVLVWFHRFSAKMYFCFCVILTSTLIHVLVIFIWILHKFEFFFNKVESCYVARAGQTHDFPASVPLVLGLQPCITTTGSVLVFRLEARLNYNMGDYWKWTDVFYMHGWCEYGEGTSDQGCFRFHVLIPNVVVFEAEIFDN